MLKKLPLAVYLGIAFFTVSLASVSMIVLYLHSVDNGITEVDKEYILKFTQDLKFAGPTDNYDDQIAFIKTVQDRVLTVAPTNTGIERDLEREPKDLYSARQGLCYDRSRTIEKILRFAGFETRHVFVYTIRDSDAISALLTPGVQSHAASEVRTSKGWLIVDSNVRWISLDKARNPHSIKTVLAHVINQRTVSKIDWKKPVPEDYTGMTPSHYIYGLYSRNGRFYPPYNIIPDIHYGELKDNF